MAEAAQRVSAEVATVVELSRFAAEFMKDMHRGHLVEGGDDSGRYDHVPAIPLIQHRSVLTQVVCGSCGDVLCGSLGCVSTQIPILPSLPPN